MLVISRNKNTSVSIGEDVLVTVRGFRQEEEQVVLEIQCPAGMTVCGPDAQEIEPSPAGKNSCESVATLRSSCSAKRYAEQSSSLRSTSSRYFVRLKVDQTVTLGGEIIVMLVALRRTGGIVCGTRLGMEAPRHMRISRPDTKRAELPREQPEDGIPPSG